jgi:hypothetical protein
MRLSAGTYSMMLSGMAMESVVRRVMRWQIGRAGPECPWPHAVVLDTAPPISGLDFIEYLQWR